MAALSNNLTNGQENDDFEQRARIADLMLKEKDLHLKAEDIASNERIATEQMRHKAESDSKNADYLKAATE